MSDWRQTGKTEDGVPIIAGSYERPPLNSSLVIFILSTPVVLIFLVMSPVIILSFVRGEVPFHYLLFDAFITVTMAAQWWSCIRTLRLRKALKRSFPLDEISVKMRAGPDAVQ